jgi:hypothetical protein
MLSSLFGDLAPRRLVSHGASEPDTVFPETLVMEDPDHPDLAVDAGSSTVDVLVDASPAQSIRDHFAHSRADLDQAAPMITLLDPTRLWAPQVLAALVDAGPDAGERLNLRDHATLRTMAVIQRATVETGPGERLKVYHADIRSNGPDDEEVAHVLAERSHMSVVIVGALLPHAVAAMVRRLVEATRQSAWRCPWLVFVLPPGAAQLRHRLLGQDWPVHVRVSVINESMMGGPSQLWQAIQEAWRGRDSGIAPLPVLDDVANASDKRRAGGPLRALGYLTATDGLLACGVIDPTSQDVLAFDSIDMPQSELAAIGRALIAARNAHGRASEPVGSRPDEVMVSVGPVTQMLRTCAGQRPLAIVVLLDRQRVSLPQLRFKLLQAEKQLG